jgi:pyruvate/2-oxoglutarate dehydrogenase complex dihydrolipoamide acyltransferase (E2) component
VQAYLKGGKQLILFDDVNVGLMIERKLEESDKRTLMGHVLRAANRKTYREIHQEIREVQATPVPANRGMPAWFRTMMSLPWPFPRLFSALFKMAARHDPTIPISMSGTVGVTAVGMFGEGQGGWGIYPMPFSLGLVVGSTAWKPAVVDGRIEPREILNLTVVFDQYVDGGPAARFTRRLVELIESGYGLDEFIPESASDSEPELVGAEWVLA